MKFCSECGKEISLRELDMTEKIDNKLVCQDCIKYVYDNDALLVR